MSCGNELVEACAILSPKHSIVTAWFHSLDRLRTKVPALQGLPAATDLTFHSWVSFIVPAQNAWKNLLKKHLTGTTWTPLRQQHSDTAAQILTSQGVEQPPMQVHTPPPAHEQDDGHDGALDDIELTCAICQKKFGTAKGLASHKRASHKIIPPLALRTYGTDCPACGTQLLTRNSLLQHLATRLVCSLHVMEYIQPMDEATYRSRVHELDTERSLLSRRIVPRTGPIPLIAGQPRSQGVKAVNPYDEDPASIDGD
eukprot:1533263-Amphidinium_carterae.1